MILTLTFVKVVSFYLVKSMKYRKLQKKEIEYLSHRGNYSQEWDKVLVSWGEMSKDRSIEYVRNVVFSGMVTLGSLCGEKKMSDGYLIHCCIENATLHNVKIGDECIIKNIGERIANYSIGSNCIIINIDILSVDTTSSFGNGTNVSVLNETGGREVIITDYLSAHAAYIMSLYRHHPQLHKKLCDIAKNYAKKCSSNIGTIQDNVIIKNSGSIVNVRIGAYSKIDGANRLYNGSLNSNKIAPIFVGSGVIMHDFIVSSGSSIDSNAIIRRCFVGQACHLGSSYSATDSLFFANCYGENGEACSIFAGPYTVTHHKSTLLIAGMFSFMNAGSGSNQSNHMYKLGPIHQGILERGAKTSSDSYILWPSKVGAFSLVMGRHVTHSDTSIFPFSYLIEQNNTTYLSPGINLRSVGTIRDAQKWPKRDERKDNNLLDLINYNMLNPYIAQKMIKGLEALNNLIFSSGELSDLYSYHSTKITNRALRKGIKFYNIALTKYFGNLIISRLQVGGAIEPVSKFAKVYATKEKMKIASEKLKFKSPDQKVRLALSPSKKVDVNDIWVDVSGMYAPKSKISNLIQNIENGRLKTFEQINAEFAKIHNSYYELEWDWAISKIEKFFNINLSQVTVKQMIEIVEKWKLAVVELDNLIYEDARKEFSLASMTGFGADGTKRDKEKDFEEVRGAFESNTFVTAVIDHIKKKTALGNQVCRGLRTNS